MARLSLVAVIAASLFAAAAAPAEEKSCAIPNDLLQDDAHLPALAARLKAKQPVRVVAIGGASTAGAAAPGPQDAYPERLKAVLEERFPGVAFTVVNKGAPRQTAQDMVDRFARDVYPESPDLTIWETGTTDAVRTIDPEAFSAVLQNGIAQLREHHSEIMLMDMQYSRRTTSVIGFDRYIEAMHRLAELENVPLFQRFAAMRYWSDNGIFDFEETGKAERMRLAARVYDCLARGVAEAIVEDVQ